MVNETEELLEIIAPSLCDDSLSSTIGCDAKQMKPQEMFEGCVFQCSEPSAMSCQVVVEPKSIEAWLPKRVTRMNFMHNLVELVNDEDKNEATQVKGTACAEEYAREHRCEAAPDKRQKQTTNKLAQ